MTSRCTVVRGFLGAAILSVFLWAGPVSAQTSVVTTYYPAQPVVSYVPEARGLLGLRTVYRPVISYASPAVTSVVPAAPVTTYYAPAVPAPVTTSYTPAAPRTTFYAPPAAPAVTTYYAPPVETSVTTYRVQTPAPAVVAPAPVTTYYAPAPVATFRPLIVP